MSKHLESEAAFEASVKGYLDRQWMAPLRKAHPTAKIEVWPMEMESYKSIAAFAARCQTLPRIDFAIPSAGLNTPERRVCEETGHEQLFQVDCVSTPLPSILLLPVLEAKRRDPHKPPRLSIVSPDGALYGSVKGLGSIFAEFDDPEQFKFPSQYVNAKLAEKVDPEKVIVHTLNPALVSGTDIGRSMAPGWIKSTLFLVMYPIARAITVGASAYAVATKGIESHWSYLGEWSIRPYVSLFSLFFFFLRVLKS